jgi:hypothetical protein
VAKAAIALTWRMVEDIELVRESLVKPEER